MAFFGLILGGDAFAGSLSSLGWTPLYAAARNGRHRVARLLLDRGANLIVTNEEGRIPLYEAAFYSQL